MDLHFNPQVHAQAIDRAHRIGQEKPVNVEMIIVENTIEQKINDLLNYKDEISLATLRPSQVGYDQIYKLL